MLGGPTPAPADRHRAMRVLITGGAGLVGSALCASTPLGVDVEVTVRARAAAEGVRSHAIGLDEPGAFASLVGSRRPDLVIHTAYSIGALERDVIRATSEVVAGCVEHGVDLVYFSTDALFDGEHAPYVESDDPSPVHDYGRAKAEAEWDVRRRLPDATVIRTSIVFSTDPLDGASSWVVDALASGRRVTLFTDEMRTPIRVGDLAEQTWEIARMPVAQRRGVWHLGGPAVLSRADLGDVLCDAFGLDRSLIDAVPSATSAVPRPRDLSLRSDRARSLSVRPSAIGSVDRHGQTQR